MAILSDAERLLVRQIFCADASNERRPLGLSKPDMIAAVSAIDQWVEDNSAEFNQAIPLPARTTLTTKEKAALLFLIANRRYGVL